jgi:hypothetical protein
MGGNEMLPSAGQNPYYFCHLLSSHFIPRCWRELRIIHNINLLEKDKVIVGKRELQNGGTSL